jgi:xylose isomerase
MTLFSGVEPVRFEGPDTANEFAYRVYDKDRIVQGGRMEEWLKVRRVLLAFLQLARQRCLWCGHA